MLCLKDVRIKYPDGTIAADGISLEIGDGESVALIGANGAGKTSLIMALVGIIAAHGEISSDGVLLCKKTVSDIRRRIGVVFQNPDDQLFMPSVYENVAFGLRSMSVPEAEIEARVDRCLSALGIGHLKKRTALKLSGGEKRMVALATVLVMEPSVMALDEPTAFLDPRARKNLIEAINGLSQTKIIATHDLAFAESVCSRVILLREGRVFADGAAEKLLHGRAIEECLL